MTIPTCHASWVFVDTSAYFALAYSKDANHNAAISIMKSMIANHLRLYTRNYILAELHALLLTKISRRTALNTLTEIDSSTAIIIRVTQDDEKRARQILNQYDDKNFSLTDATCFSLMERSGIYKAFSFDGNFSQYGLTVLTPELLR